MSKTDDTYTPDDCEFLYRDTVFSDATTPEVLARAETFEFRSDDIVICTFPRNGTTLTQEIMWEVVNSEIITRGGDFGAVSERFCFMEYSKYPQKNGLIAIDSLEKTPPGTQRLIKTHLPYFFIRDQIEKVNPRTIIVIRNPKDSAVALYHFYRAIRDEGWECGWEEFLRRFMTGKTVFGDFFSNCLEWWSLRDRSNVLILRYEDILSNKPQQVRTIADFLGCKLTPEKVDIVVHNSDFKTMSKNPSVNIVIGRNKETFLRKGIAGDWKSHFTVAQNEAMEALIEKRLAGSSLRFIY